MIQLDAHVAAAGHRAAVEDLLDGEVPEVTSISFHQVAFCFGEMAQRSVGLSRPTSRPRKISSAACSFDVQAGETCR